MPLVTLGKALGTAAPVVPPTYLGQATTRGAGGVTTLAATMPSGITAGERLVAFVANYGTNAVRTASASGWSALVNTNFSGMNVGILTKVADGSEGPSQNITWSSAGTSREAFVVRFSSCSVDTQAVDGFSGRGGSFNLVLPSITLTRPAVAFGVAFAFATISSAATWTPPATWTEDVEVAGSTNSFVWELIEKTFAAAGATGTATAVSSQSATNGGAHVIGLYS